MVETYVKKDKLEFRDIILQHIKKILEISTLEFRGGYDKKVFVGSIVYDEYIPDTRKCYIQSVESLSDVLHPYFDKPIQKIYNDIMKKINSITDNIKKKEKSGDLTELEIKTFTLEKLELCRRLFRELNFLLYRKKYLGKKQTIG